MSTTTNGTNGSPGGGRGKAPVPLRTALLLLMAAFVGSVIGLLAFAAAANLPTAVIAGVGAAGAAFYYGHELLGDE